MRRRRADDLFDRIATFGALCAVASRAAAGKRRGPVRAWVAHAAHASSTAVA